MLCLVACCCCRQVASVVSDSVRPHRRQPTRLPRRWASPGKNTGVGCHFLLQCLKVKSESEVAQSCLTLSVSMDCSLPDFSVQGIFQARVLEWGAIAFSNIYVYVNRWMCIYVCVYTYIYIYIYMCVCIIGYKHSFLLCKPYRRRQWHPTPVLLPGKSHGWRSLVGCSPWGH